MNVTFSLLIVTYNPGAIFRECIARARTAAAGLDAEILVIDNGSTDETIDWLRADYPDIRIIANADNHGFAAANNQGIAASRGDLMLLLNPDALLEPDTLRLLAAHFAADPGCGVAAPRMLNAVGAVALNAYPAYTVDSVLFQYWGLGRLFPRAAHNRYQRACETAVAPFSVAWAQGSCLLIRHTVIEAIGGLDEGFFLFCEEPDFCERAARAGWTTAIVPAARFTHHESSAVSRYPLVKIRAYHLSPLHYFAKRGDRGAVRALKLGFTGEILLKWAIRLVQPGRGSEAAHAKRAAYRQVLGEIWRYRG